MFGLSHVCRSWREVLLSLGSLWASKVDVSSSGPALNRLVVERTGSRPLDICLREVSVHHGYHNLLLWLQTSHRLRAETIDIRCFGGRFSTLLSEHIGPSLPTLQHVKIRFCNLEYEDDESQDSFEMDDLVLVKTLSICNAPALTSVVLYNCLLPWHADVFSQLTRLHIDIDASFSSTRVQQPTHAELRSVLTGMRKLVDLYLLNIFPDYTHAHEALIAIYLSPTCERVRLSSHSIAQCTADDENFNSTQLAMTLVPPVTAAFHLEQSCFGELGHSLRAFAGPLRPPQALSLRTAAHPSASSVVVGHDASEWLNSPLDALDYTPGRHVTITFRSEVSHDDELSEWDIQSRQKQYRSVLYALRQIDLSELRVLRIDGLRCWEDQTYLFRGKSAWPLPAWQNEAPLFSRAENVEVLIISARTDMRLLEQALVEHPFSEGDLLFPRLHTIAMQWPRKESFARAAVVHIFQQRYLSDVPVKTFQVLQARGQEEGWEDLEEFTEVDTYYDLAE